MCTRLSTLVSPFAFLTLSNLCWHLRGPSALWCHPSILSVQGFFFTCSCLRRFQPNFSQRCHWANTLCGHFTSFSSWTSLMRCALANFAAFHVLSTDTDLNTSCTLGQTRLGNPYRETECGAGGTQHTTRGLRCSRQGHLDPFLHGSNTHLTHEATTQNGTLLHLACALVPLSKSMRCRWARVRACGGKQERERAVVSESESVRW
jgi:hypothetical protein